MKRLLVRICLFLILGAIVNVAVAWGCALRSEIELTEATRWTTRDEHESQWKGVGIEVRESLLEVGFGNRIIGAAETYIVAGWPSHALEGSVSSHPFTVGMPFTSAMEPVATDAALIVSVPGSSRDVAPIGVIWPGFAFNTVFYALVLWLLFAGPFVVRRWRRIRRGLCPKCAYDLRGTPSEACPECGAAVIGERMKLHALITNGLTGISMSYSLEDSQQINEAELAALLDASSQSQRKGVERGTDCDVSRYAITARGARRKWTIEFHDISISDKSQELLKWIERHCKRA